MTTTAGWCPACGRVVEAFVPGPGGRPGARCPRCQALERHRFLALLIDRLSPVIASAGMVLDVAPQPQVRGLLQRYAGDRYVGIDLLEERLVDVWADMTRLPFPDGRCDLAVCYHVFEHIPDDASAMRELARVLSPGGIALVQVPWRRGAPTDEDPAAPDEERIRRFGQADHVRWYGEDLLTRLRDAGLHASVLEPAHLLDAQALQRLGVATHEPVLLCRRAATGQHRLEGHGPLTRLGPLGLRAGAGGEAPTDEARRLAGWSQDEHIALLEGQLREVYRSTTWRVGDAMLAGPKRLKRRLRRR